MAPRRTLLAAVIMLTALPAGARAQSPASLAAALRSDPVFADPAAKPTLTTAEAGRVRLEILDRNLGRIKIAVVSTRTAGQAGGVRDLANAIDSHLRTPGTLMVVAGDSAWVTTSYPRPQQAVVAVRRAFARDGTLADHLVASVRGLARVDPGPSGDLERTTAPGVPQIDDAAEDFLDTVKLIFWVVGALIALPFAIGGFLLLRALWRSVRHSREAVGDDRSDLHDSLVQLGERIRELDVQGGVFEGDPVGQSAYERALDAYERAERLLPDANSARRLARVRAALDEGQKHVAVAKDPVGGPPGAPPPTTPQPAGYEQANKAFGRD